MGRFDRFAPQTSNFVTPEQQAANFRAANEHKRAPRPHQKPPTVRGQGQKRKHTQESNLPLDDEQTAGGSKGRQSSQWGQRMRRREEAWAEQRESNKQCAVQYHSLLSEGIQLLQLAAAEHCAVTAICRAALLHPCLMVALEADELAALEKSLLQQLEAAMGDRSRPPPEHQQQQQQGPLPQQQQQQEPLQQQPEPSLPQQQQQQQHEQAPPIQVVGTRLVACHTLGASFWLPVPTVRCQCCKTEWEQQPAAAGFFGSTPVQPWALFSQQLLDFYTPLCTTGGCSFTNMAAAVDRGNVKTGDPQLKVDAR